MLPMKATAAKKAPAMKAAKKAMKAMPAKKSGSVMTVSGAYSSVAETMGLKPKEVKGAIEGVVSLAAQQLKKNGKFKLGTFINLKLKVKPATPARKGVNPFTKEPCVFKAKPASKTVKGFPMKKLKEMIN